MIILFQSILFFKKIYCMQWLFWVFTRIKKDLGLAFGAYFQHDFSIEISLFNTQIKLSKFQCHIFFPSQDINQNALLSSHLETIRDAINFKIYLRSSSNAIANREKYGKTEIWISHSMPLISFDNPWKHVFWCFQGVSKEISGMKWDISRTKRFFIII